MKPPTIFILITFVLCLHRESSGLNPLIRPNKKEIVINAGDEIHFECIHTSKIFFFYPKYDDQDGQKIVASQAEVGKFEGDGSYKYVFSRPNATSTDTGWYGCADHNVTITPKVFDDAEFSWIYFYVSSSDRIFIEENMLNILDEMEGQVGILPCRPTSPDLKVNLYNEKTGEKVEINRNISYDPKFGFKFDHLRISDRNFYKCVTTVNGKQHEISYFMQVVRNSDNDLMIHDNTLKHVIRGQNLYVNCTTYLRSGATDVLNWITPSQSSRISEKVYIRKINEKMEELVKELIIKNVTTEDEGEYTCYIKTDTRTKEQKTYLKLYDPPKYINLIPQDTTLYYKQQYHGQVKWVVMIDAYPEPAIKWLHPNGSQIFSDKKYFIKTTSSSTSLTIYHLDVTDMGVYQLRCTNSDNANKSLNFTLEVSTKPILQLKNIKEYYAPNQNIYIECKVSAFPEPNITWNFRQCPHYPSMKDSKLIELKSEKKKLKPYAFVSKKSMKIDVSGVINCTACNSIGCEYAFEYIFVSDGNGDFGILEPNDQITEGDNISIICEASIFTYTSNFTWTKGDENKTIVNNEDVTVIEEVTPSTYRSILHIHNVRKKDADLYTCFVEKTNKQFKAATCNLFVNDQRPMIFTNSSLKGRDLNIDLGKEFVDTITLMCHVDGMPKPNVTWYKDGISLNNEINYHYLFSNHNQELRIKYLDEKLSGKYFCRATNRLNTIKDFINILIKRKQLFNELIFVIAILFGIGVVLVIYFVIKIQREKKLRKELLQNGLMHFKEDALECLNPGLTVDEHAELIPPNKK